MVVNNDASGVDALVVVPAAAAVVNTPPATAAGAAKAPIAAAMAMVKMGVGPVRPNTFSISPDIRSLSISRPRARRCFTASSLTPN
ncbi:MAG TPA: hypothetical protein VNM37_17680, partial [Candidatus Dormibacteraeota bacterium]|nr:hypothetical protein [Candidatus Dormibacteraeota bacterium]